MKLSESYKTRIQELSGIISGHVFAEPIIKRDWFNIPNEYKQHPNEDENLEEIAMDDIKIPEKYIKDTLNPKIWDNFELRLEVKEKLLEIVKEFEEYLDVKAKPKDVKIVGSMTNYNWSSKSDIDIHLFFDLSEINDDENLVKELLDAKESIWKAKHQISIHGFTVELYAQDIKDKYYSGGVYNLLKNEWEKKPKKEEYQIDKTALKKKLQSVINQIEKLEEVKDKKSPEEVYNSAHNLKEKIKKMRQAGLEKGGELSIENLVFKYLRNEGYFGKLMEISREAFDKNLSIKQ